MENFIGWEKGGRKKWVLPLKKRSSRPTYQRVNKRNLKKKKKKGKNRNNEVNRRWKICVSLNRVGLRRGGGFGGWIRRVPWMGIWDKGPAEDKIISVSFSSYRNYFPFPSPNDIQFWPPSRRALLVIIRTNKRFGSAVFSRKRKSTNRPTFARAFAKGAFPAAPTYACVRVRPYGYVRPPGGASAIDRCRAKKVCANAGSAAPRPPKKAPGEAAEYIP